MELAMAQLSKSMFREYDIRGRVNEIEINEYSVNIIAKAYGTMLRNRNINTSVVGYDLRRGSKKLCEVSIEGLISTGVNVIAIGQVLTPILYAAQHYYDSFGGMMVTASHNPNGWLGFKLGLGLSNTLGPEEMDELYNLTLNEEFASGDGKLTREDYIPIYSKDVLSRVNIKRPVKVLINTGNGTAGPIVPQILRDAGCEVFEFLTEPDLNFNHYFPNPSKVEMMNDTGSKTLHYDAELGIAFDGDGDRLGITDEKGNVIWPDRYIGILCQSILKEHKGAPIVYDVKCSRGLEEYIRALGGNPVMWKTGHSYIKQKLHEISAPFAGEMSGHIFFGSPIYYGFDDAVFAALKLLEVLSDSNSPLSKMIEEIPTYVSTPTLQANCSDERKYDLVDSIVAELIDDGHDVVTFDDNYKLGGRVEFPNGWGLIRASSNLPVLVLRFEAVDDETLLEIKSIIKIKMDKYDEIGKEWVSG